MNPRVLVFCEDHAQPEPDRYQATYPRGIGPTIADALRARGLQVTNAFSTQPENGLTEAALEGADVVIYWAHKADRFVSDEVVARLHDRVLRGMGLIALHSSVGARIFHRLIGTTARMFWRVDGDGERERIWVMDPQHPIADGLGRYIELGHEEMYGEPFGIPTPDELVFVSWFEGGEVFRSGCCWRRGRGRVFYFRPGHETVPTYHNPDIQRVLYNAAKWAAPVGGIGPTRQHEGVPVAPEHRYAKAR